MGRSKGAKAAAKPGRLRVPIPTGYAIAVADLPAEERQAEIARFGKLVEALAAALPSIPRCRDGGFRHPCRSDGTCTACGLVIPEEQDDETEED